MPRVRRDQDGIARTHFTHFAVDFHAPLPFEDEVELFAELVVVAFGGLPHGNCRLGETLVLHGRVGPIQDAADGAAVLGGKRRLLGKLIEGHATPSLNAEAGSATQKFL